MANKDIEISLYHGKHSVLFKNGSHRYYVDGKPKTGVTTIMGKVLAKPGLMLWPLNMALTHLQNKLPTLTQADLDEAATAYIKRRDAGADAGTIVHDLAEKLLLHQSIDLTEYVDKSDVMAAYAAFKAWVDELQPEVMAAEQVVYSPAKDYTGTYDSILKIGDKTYLCDLKTTNASREAPHGVYADYFIQLGAYLYAYTEERMYELQHFGISKLVPINDLMIISCKKDGSLHTKTASEIGLSLDACKKMWLATLLLYRQLDKTKKMLGGK